MKILVLDNYDSFTYNLVHYVHDQTGEMPAVYRNDEIDLSEVARYDKILLSPGPGLPAESGILLDLIKTYAATKSILGVCLGHQAIAESFGASLFNMQSVIHGMATMTRLTSIDDNLFEGLPDHFMTGRYHSWSVSRENFPDELLITATDKEDRIMALKHTHFDLRGVQFHPESILTPQGRKIINNWLDSTFRP